MNEPTAGTSVIDQAAQWMIAGKEICGNMRARRDKLQAEIEEIDKFLGSVSVCLPGAGDGKRIEKKTTHPESQRAPSKNAGPGPGTMAERILRELDAKPDSEWNAAELTKRVGRDPLTVASELSRMWRKGWIEKVGHGLYQSKLGK